MLLAVTERILDEWSGFFPEAKRPSDIHYMAIPGSVEGGTTTFLAFTARSPKPVFVVKVARAGEDAAPLRKEARMLGWLRSLGGQLSVSIPHPLMCEQVAGVWVLVESMLNGHPMIAKVRAKGWPDVAHAARNFELVNEWVIRLHRRTHETSAELVQLARKRIVDTIDDFLQIFPLSRSERQLAERIGENIDVLLGAGLFVRHGDFCRQNILVQRGSHIPCIAVIDWTFCESEEVALHDLFFFITTYLLQVRRTVGPLSIDRVFLDSFFERNPYSEMVASTVLDCTDQLQMDRAVIDRLFAMFLLNQSVFEYFRVSKAVSRGNIPRSLAAFAKVGNGEWGDALFEQLWIRLFRLYVKHRYGFMLVT